MGECISPGFERVLVCLSVVVKRRAVGGAGFDVQPQIDRALGLERHARRYPRNADAPLGVRPDVDARAIREPIVSVDERQSEPVRFAIHIGDLLALACFRLLDVGEVCIKGPGELAGHGLRRVVGDADGDGKTIALDDI